MRMCWCGDDRLERFSTHYRACVACGTLVSQVHGASGQVDNEYDVGEFYGREYWFSRQRDRLELPDIDGRARLDLPERCLYWLRTLLSYKLPPGRVLDVGSAHGAFVSALRYAGFDAVGLEVSPWVVDYARRMFRIPVLAGAIEQQDLPAGSFDAVILNDVLEHLLDPVTTMGACVSALKPDGVLLIQTPRYPDPQTHQDLERAGHPFLKMLLEDEHIYLFSERALHRLLESLGRTTLLFKPPLFPYDMYVVASRHAPAESSPDAIAAALSATPDGRMALALLDLDDRERDLKARYAELAADRDSHVRSLLEHQAQLADKQDAIETVAASLEQLSRDNETRLDVMLQQQTTIAEQQGFLSEVTRSLEQVSADGEARLQAIMQHQATIAKQQDVIAEITRSLELVSADGEARLQVILEQQATIAAQQATIAEQQAALGRYRATIAE